jgi:xylulokinase
VCAKPLLAALDIGTSGVRAVAFTPDGTAIAEGRCPLSSHYPMGGGAEQQPRDWWDATTQALRLLSAQLQDEDALTQVAGLALTGQCPTLALLDPEHGPTGRALLYQDNRASAEAERLVSRFGAHTMHARSGQMASAFYLLPKLLWLRQQSLALEKLVPVQPRDLIGWYLTGRVVTDPTHAACTLAYDLHTQHWAEDWLLDLGLSPEHWPEIVPSCSIQGYLTPEAARQSGLPTGLPIITGAADSICAAYGAQQALEPGLLCEVTGTSTCLHMTVNEPVDAPAINSYPHILPAHWYSETGLNTTGGALAWLSTLLQRSPDRLIEEAGQSPAASEGLFFMPHLSGGERDLAGRRGAFIGLQLGSSAGQLGRALLEGVGYALCQQVTLLEASGCPVSRILSCGGSAHSTLWAQIKADILARPVVMLSPADTTTWGAALLVARTLGIDVTPSARRTHEVVPQEARAAIYRCGYEQFCTLEQAITLRATGEEQRSILYG